MSLLIKGMDMPKYCCDCLFCENHVYCRLLKIDLWHHAIWSERHLLCPLVGVPNHDEIDTMPTADVVEVIPCKDCFYAKPYNKKWQLPINENLLWCEHHNEDKEPNWFCADAIRREQ